MTMRPDTRHTPASKTRSVGRVLLLLGGGAIIGGAVVAHNASAAPTSAGVRATSVTTAAAPAAPVVSQIDQLREQAINRVRYAVVEVENVGKGLGSGFIISQDGYIVTNNHVVAGAQQLQVDLVNGTKIGARLVGADPVDDLAVVKIGATKLPTAEFDSSATLRIGQTVLAIGNPLGYASTVTDGIVSALNRTVSEGQGSGRIKNAIQTSAAINPGNSGGALIDLNGRVVGVPTLAAVDPEFNTPGAGVGFAIPSNTVQNIASQIIKYGKVVHSGQAYLGIGSLPVTPQLQQQYNLPIDHGVLVQSLSSGGPAQKAGIQQGDIIVKVGGTTINTYDDLVSALANVNPGATIPVTVVTARNQQHTYRVKLAERVITSNG